MDCAFKRPGSCPPRLNSTALCNATFGWPQTPLLADHKETDEVDVKPLLSLVALSWRKTAVPDASDKLGHKAGLWRAENSRTVATRGDLTISAPKAQASPSAKGALPEGRGLCDLVPKGSGLLHPDPQWLDVPMAKVCSVHH